MIMGSGNNSAEGKGQSSGVAETVSNDGRAVSVSINAGKGKIIPEHEVIEAARGKYLVLDLTEEMGPCPDDMCQLKPKIKVRILDSINDQYEVIRTGRFTLAISKAVWHAIDKGRQEVYIRKGRFGNLSVKGFSLTF